MVKLTKKIVFGAVVSFVGTFANAQTVQEGIEYVDSHKFAKARGVFDQMIQKAPSEANNYFYIGNTYLTQFEPNFDKAEEYFNKGLSVDSRNILSKIGLATIKLGKGNKSAVAEIQSLVGNSKDSEVLYRAAEALTMFEKNNAPDMAIAYLDKAIERSKKDGIPAYFYYTKGDAFRLKKMPGEAMSAYDEAVAVAKNKASVYTRMATLWMAAQKWQLAKENIDNALKVDITYAPAYKALAMYNWRFQRNAEVTKDLINYTKYADEDPYTTLEISKQYFINEEYGKAKELLSQVFDKVDDPIKFKLRALLDYKADANYISAKEDLEAFMNGVKDKARIQPADRGLEGLIIAGLAQSEKDETKKQQMLLEANQKVEIAKAAKDETFNWNEEMSKVSGGEGSAEAIAAGPSNAKIEELRKTLAENPKNTDVLLELGTAYQEVQNWHGALATWRKMAELLPTWEYSYYGQGVAYQMLGNDKKAESSYQKYIDTLLAKPAEAQEQNKVTLSYAYYLVAYFSHKTNVDKAKDYVAKALQLNPEYQDAVNLNKILNQ